MKVIVACAGSSSRFPNMAPKWMLPDYDGQPMIRHAVAGLGVGVDDLIVTILRDHDERFNAAAGLARAFGPKLTTVILDAPTGSQSETVAETLKATGLAEPFLVKDSDNYFELAGLDHPSNYVSVASLNDFDHINARNKSYVQVDGDGLIGNMREKQVISDLFSVGGYFFRSPAEFLAAYGELAEVSRPGELYLSNVIAFMILNGHAFTARNVARYQDWGTIHEWRAKLEGRRVFMVSVDGFLFERGSSFFAPAFADAAANPQAVEAARAMAEGGNMLIYLSIRPPELEALTRAQLAAQGLPDGQIIFGCGIAQWSLVTSAHSSLPFTTSHALEVDPADPNLSDKLHLAG